MLPTSDTLRAQLKTAARHSSLLQRLRELWHYRELIRNLVVSDLKTRYKNSVLGFFWSLLNPLGMMLVFTVVFAVLMPNVKIEKYPLFLLCGLLPWNYFSTSVTGSLYSVVGNSNLVKKVYFPRDVLPIATVLANWSISCWPCRAVRRALALPG